MLYLGMYLCTDTKCVLTDTRSEMEGTVKMYQVESFSWLWSRQARKLINESMGTFLSLQTSVKDAGPDNCKPLLVKKCREYR